ncbi:MAG: helix-turn-helix domain-containing protein, partial [Bacilli bacterium]|nr:helix-turn-helix domain-containing protein [Bacilli bacterium]
MVFKIEKTKNYTIMSNYHLRDINLSLKAKGLLSFMLSLPEDWDYSLNGLVSVSKESKKAIRSILNELKENGYLIVEQTREKNGYYKYNYIIYEVPSTIEKQKINPYTQKGDTDRGNIEKDTQINTNKTNTKEQIDKTDKIDKTIDDFQNSAFAYDNNYSQLTNDLIRRGYID